MNSFTLLHLSLIPTIGPQAVKKVLELIIVKGLNVYDLSVSDYRFYGIDEQTAQKIVFGLHSREGIDKEYALLEKTGVQWTTVVDAEYPHLLFNTYAPPPVIYWQGDPVWLSESPTLAVVGSRQASLYGERIVNDIVAPCVQHRMTIISGGARGIDTLAHHATLKNGGKTVVVLGSGLLKPYLVSHKNLFEQVIYGGGAVVSCFSLETEALPWRFPMRNRLIAGMAQGCFVVQAAQESGALITAKYALEEGRSVYTVPGLFDDPLSAGCHTLLKEGAQLVTGPYDILQDYGFAHPVVELVSVKKEKQPYVQKVVPFVEKSDSLKNSLEALCARPISLYDLVEQTGKDESELKVELFELQLAGKVDQDFAGLWFRV